MKPLGFTLMEMVVTMVIVSIMFLGIAGIVQMSVQGYSDTARRQALQNQARFVIEKMSREIRHAIPNSLEATNGGACISFFPIRFSGLYQLQPSLSGGNGTLTFIIGNTGFEDAEFNAAITAGARLVINPSRVDDLDLASSASVSLVGLTTISAGGATYSLSASFPSNSISNRHYIYIPNDRAQYCLNMGDGSITRSAANATVQVGENVTSGAFVVNNVSLQRGGLVNMTILFESNGEQSQYTHDVQVMNVP